MFNIIQNRKIWFTLSIILVLGSLLVIFINGLKLGIDFTGGSLLEVKIISDDLESVDKIEEKIYVNLPELQEIKVQSSSENQFIIRSKPLSESEHHQIIQALSNQAEVEELRFESIGPTLGKELKDKSIIALIVASLVIIFYIAWSFRKVSKVFLASWKYGIGAIIALTHDVIIVTGVYSLFALFSDLQIDALFVTALLVVLGYSVNDTIVVYDRIRENVIKSSGNFEELVNKSVNQTISRSINTSLTTLFVLFALYFLGGRSISGFVLALIVGIIIGTYSSIFLASPILVIWERRGKK